jgi:hypothetical protein
MPAPAKKIRSKTVDGMVFRFNLAASGRWGVCWIGEDGTRRVSSTSKLITGAVTYQASLVNPDGSYTSLGDRFRDELRAMKAAVMGLTPEERQRKTRNRRVERIRDATPALLKALEGALRRSPDAPWADQASAAIHLARIGVLSSFKKD